MKVAIHVNNAAHQRTHGAAMKAGLERHGIAVEFAPFNEPQPCDVAVIWGWKQPLVTASAPATLVMERGHLQDRMAYTSCGWNGLAGRGSYPDAPDAGARWRERFAHLLKPWKPEPQAETYALLLGQVPGDAALYGLDLDAWAQRTCDALLASGRMVRYRPHPLVLRCGDVRCPAGALGSAASLDEDLAGAALAVTFNSTAGVEAVLAGVPTVALDAGAMAWPVTTHDLANVQRPDREPWAHRLAWCQWTIEELASGLAWEHLAAAGERKWVPCH